MIGERECVQPGRTTSWTLYLTRSHKTVPDYPFSVYNKCVDEEVESHPCLFSQCWQIPSTDLYPYQIWFQISQECLYCMHISVCEYYSHAWKPQMHRVPVWMENRHAFSGVCFYFPTCRSRTRSRTCADILIGVPRQGLAFFSAHLVPRHDCIIAGKFVRIWL